LTSVAAGNVCRLECCAARAPHAAGSCMNGSCHAALKGHQHLRRSAQPTVADEFCGLAHLVHRDKHHAASAEVTETGKSLAMFVRPCDRDCGNSAIGSVSAKGMATVTNAQQSQPPVRLSAIDNRRLPTFEFSSREYSPRGPPTTFSA